MTRTLRKKFCSIGSLAALMLITAAVDGRALTVTDEIGRKVDVPTAPQRIVSLAPGITETLYFLGLGNRIAGVTTFCNWPADARNKPRVGGFTNPSVEKIVSLNPDLIIATADGNRKDVILQLQRLGLTVYVINPSSAEKILQSIERLGVITDRKEAARKLSEKLRKRLRAIKTGIADRKKPRVFFQIGLEPLITASGRTLIGEAIALAGGVNIAAEDTARYPRYSAEGVMAGAPDVILFAPMAKDREFKTVKKFWMRFLQIPAVRDGRIYPVNTDLISRASPRMFDAIEDMARILHPDMERPGR